MFRYTWQVRDEWFKWCKQVPVDELIKDRTGGVGSILRTLYHVVDIEAAWINELQSKTWLPYNFMAFNSLDKVMDLSSTSRPEIERFALSFTPDVEMKILAGIRNGTTYSYYYGEVVRHVIAHEMHHIGQLSVWARELGPTPISANLIGRGLFESSDG